VQLKLESQINIVFSLYSEDFTSLSKFIQTLIATAHDRRFKSFLKIGDFKRIPPKGLKDLKSFLIDSIKNSTTTPTQKQRIQMLFDKIDSFTK